jgi:hypothetical protein
MVEFEADNAESGYEGEMCCDAALIGSDRIRILRDIYGFVLLGYIDFVLLEFGVVLLGSAIYRFPSIGNISENRQHVMTKVSGKPTAAYKHALPYF